MNPVETVDPKPAEPFAEEPLQFLQRVVRAAAHDLSNQLLAVEWSASLFEECIRQPAEVRELAREIDEAAGRARSILAFLSLLAEGARAPGGVEVGPLIGHAASLVRQVLGPAVGVDLDAARCDACRLAIDPRGFVQVLLRLAMLCVGERPGGVVRIEAETLRPLRRTSGPPRLQIALHRARERRGEAPEGRPGRPEPQPAAGEGAGLAAVAAFVERALGGQLIHRATDEGSSYEIRLPLTELSPGPEGGDPGRTRARSAGVGR